MCIMLFFVIFCMSMVVRNPSPPEELDSTLKLDASSTHGDPCEVQNGQVSHAGEKTLLVGESWWFQLRYDVSVPIDMYNC